MKYYPVNHGDFLTSELRHLLPENMRGFTETIKALVGNTTDVKIKAVKSGEYRNPRKGEFYLSGAIPMAYRAPSDFRSPYHIARIVLVKEIKKITFVPIQTIGE